MRSFFLEHFLRLTKGKAKSIPLEFSDSVAFLKELKLNSRTGSDKKLQSVANLFSIPRSFFSLFTKLYGRGRQKSVGFEEYAASRADFTDILELSSNPFVSLVNESTGDVMTMNRSLLTLFQN